MKFFGFENIVEGFVEGRIFCVNGFVIEFFIEVFGRIRVGIRLEDIVLFDEFLKSLMRNIF